MICVIFKPNLNQIQQNTSRLFCFQLFILISVNSIFSCASDQRKEKNTEKDRETDERGFFAGHSSKDRFLCLPFHLIERANDLFESQLTEYRVGQKTARQTSLARCAHI